jgi:hypothetical protein
MYSHQGFLFIAKESEISDQGYIKEIVFIVSPEEVLFDLRYCLS